MLRSLREYGPRLSEKITFCLKFASGNATHLWLLSWWNLRPGTFCSELSQECSSGRKFSNFIWPFYFSVSLRSCMPLFMYYMYSILTILTFSILWVSEKTNLLHIVHSIFLLHSPNLLTHLTHNKQFMHPGKYIYYHTLFKS